MGRRFWVLALIGIGFLVAPVKAGITVSSFDTQASANAYAPLDRSAYFDTDDHPNASPASASVSDNWSGMNFGGSDTTWNMIASAQISSVTTATPTNLTITGAGSFSYNITTTAGFVDPTSVTTLFTPGADSGYDCTFTVDTPENYVLTAQLNHLGSVSLVSLGTTAIIFQQLNFGTSSKAISTSGMLSPGQYQLGMGANDSGPSNLPRGINQIAITGGINTFSLIVQVPEPVGLFAACVSSMLVMLGRRPWH